MNLTPIFALLSVIALAEATTCGPGSVFATLYDSSRRPFVKAEQVRFGGSSCFRRLGHRTQEAASQLCSTYDFCDAYDNRQMQGWLSDKREPLWYDSAKHCLHDHSPDPESCKCNCGPYREVCLPLDLVRQHIPGFGSRATDRVGSESDVGSGFGLDRETGSGSDTNSGTGSDSSSGSGSPLYKWYNKDSYVHEKCLNWHTRPVTFEQAAKDCGSRRLCDSFDKDWQQPRLLNIKDDRPLPANGWECIKRFDLSRNSATGQA